ncbi:MAG: secretin N-terminal domain-containing protein [Kiritimatiellia bacterium]
MKNQMWQVVVMVGCSAVLLSGYVFADAHPQDAEATVEVQYREPLVAVPMAPLVALPQTDVAAVDEPASASGPLQRKLPTMEITNLELPDTVEIVTLLRLMARLADINMLISPRVTGTIGFTFHGVTWDNAFRSIIASAGLAYEWEEDVLRVMTIEDLRRELEMETARRDRESVRLEMLQSEPLVLEVIPIRYVSAASIGKTVARMITGGEPDAGTAIGGGKAAVSVDAESNAIIVHATRGDVDKARNLVLQLDQIRPLVQIEAQIVEATRDTARQLGMQWGASTARKQGSRVIGISDAGVTLGGYASDFPASFVPGGQSPVGFGVGLVSDRLGMNELLRLQLTALQQQGQINIQANPTVTTLDNEMAIIESGEERAYRVSTGTGNVLDVSLEWKKAVLRLEVTPHVVDENMLRVLIVANKDSFDETKPTTNNEFPVNTKRARTTVMLANGETTMIGGFSLESRSETKAGVPVLMHIPVLGMLFRSKTNLGRFDETIIFITPTIL